MSNIIGKITATSITMGGGTTVVTDPSLTLPGVPADAQATGMRINEVKESIGDVGQLGGKTVVEAIVERADIPETVPNIETAKVGQVVTVAEVDGDSRPVRWEATDAGGGVSFTTDGTLILDPETNVLSVNTADAVEEDNTLPITSAAVYATVGNIEALLGTI